MSEVITVDEIARAIDPHAFLPPKDKAQAQRRFDAAEKAYEKARWLMSRYTLTRKTVAVSLGVSRDKETT